MPIYARTSGGVYKGISKILTADGSEIGKVVDSTGQIIYEASRLITVTGVPPISFTKSIGKPLVSWDLLGNAQQTGTPSPDNIIMPTFCGVRTGNLFDDGSASYGEWINSNGSPAYTSDYAAYKDLEVGTAENFVAMYNGTKPYSHSIIFWDANGDFIQRIHRSNPSATGDSFPVPEGAVKARYQVAMGSSGTMTEAILRSMKIMLNLGSTALPYEPYGYKIPFNNHGDNLFDKTTATINYRVTASGTTYSEGVACTDYINIEGLSEITVSSKPNVTNIYFYSSKTANADSYVNNFSATIPDSAKYVRVNFPKNDLETFMLNSGSTAKPYSPYFSVTVPVYLGQTQTVRRVKKLVLTGKENWSFRQNQNGTFRFYTLVQNIHQRNLGLSTHYPKGSAERDFEHFDILVSGVIRFNGGEILTVNDFKAYLAQQYQNGTPVTVWYVLATPETGIVNEPLAKIGDYADELHSTDTAVTIPTTKGNNTLTVDTTLPPSSMTIVYKGKPDSGS